MKKLTVKGTDEFPEIILDSDKNVFLFAGKSMPEDVKEFYEPVLKWIDDYAKNPNEKTEVEFKMEYFNTASSKRLLDILEGFESIKEKDNDVFIKWCFRENDDDMEEAGESFFEIVDIAHEIIAVKSDV